MKNLSSYLSKISQVLNKDSFTKERILKVIEEETKIILKGSEVHLKEGVLEITASSVVKNEIKLKESKILSSLKSQGVNAIRVFYK